MSIIHEKFMSQHLHSDFKIRISDDLKEKIRRSADNLNRSMTADIVARLEASFEADSKSTDGEKADYEELKQELKREMKLMSEEINALVNQITEYQNRKY